MVIIVLSIVLTKVSIQLVSPASGDLNSQLFLVQVDQVSIQLVSPASGDTSRLNPYRARSLEAVCDGVRF